MPAPEGLSQCQAPALANADHGRQGGQLGSLGSCHLSQAPVLDSQVSNMGLIQSWLLQAFSELQMGSIPLPLSSSWLCFPPLPHSLLVIICFAVSFFTLSQIYEINILCGNF